MKRAAMTQKKREAWLDYARIFAILCVICCHAVENYYGAVVSGNERIDFVPWIVENTLFTIGRLGVPLFLAISGTLLLNREKDVYICNTVKCRPPENRNPLPDEKEACWEYLQAQLDIIKPQIILLCGNVAVQSILGNVGGITKIRGKWFEGGDIVHGAKLMPIFHPSYLLRNDTREKGGPKWLMWQDIQEIKREYDKL